MEWVKKRWKMGKIDWTKRTWKLSKMMKMVGKGQRWNGVGKKIKPMWNGMLRKLEWMKKRSSCELQGQVAKGGEQKGVHNTFLHAFFFLCFVSAVDFTPFLSMTSSFLISNASFFPITCLTLSCIIHVVLGSLLKGFNKPKNQKITNRIKCLRRNYGYPFVSMSIFKKDSWKLLIWK